jgi:hypothetical protein
MRDPMDLPIRGKDKFDTYAEIAGGVSGLPERAWPGLAEIFRQIAKDEREACAALIERRYSDVHGISSIAATIRDNGND